MTTPQGMLELADELDGIVSALKMGGKGNEVWMANSDAPTIQRAAAALRLSASPAGNGGRAVEVDIGAAMAALQASPELCEMMNEMVGGPALVEAQAEIERLNAIIALTPAVAPDGAREALEEALRGLEYTAPAIPVLRTMFMTANLKLGAAKAEEMDASNKEVIEECKAALKRHPHQPVEDKREAMQERIAKLSQVLTRFHRNACYPDAMPHELYQTATEIAALALPRRRIWKRI